MPNEVSSLRKKEVQVLFFNSRIRLSYPGLCVEDIALPLDPSVFGDVFPMVPTLGINNAIMYLDRLENVFGAFSSTNLVITMDLHLSVNFLLQGPHLGNLWNTD